MMTPDDNTNHGETNPDAFPARREVIQFCHNLRSNRDLSIIRTLPSETSANYQVNLHKPEIQITKNTRKSYFSELLERNNQVVFLDPDNGLEPENQYNEKHVRYSEIFAILEQLSSDSVVSVFQHFRRIKFTDDFKRIKERLSCLIPSVYSTAIFWHQLMFVLISKSEASIEQVREVNYKYSAFYPVDVL